MPRSFLVKKRKFKDEIDHQQVFNEKSNVICELERNDKEKSVAETEKEQPATEDVRRRCSPDGVHVKWHRQYDAEIPRGSSLTASPLTLDRLPYFVTRQSHLYDARFACNWLNTMQCPTSADKTAFVHRRPYPLVCHDHNGNLIHDPAGTLVLHSKINGNNSAVIGTCAENSTPIQPSSHERYTNETRRKSCDSIELSPHVSSNHVVPAAKQQIDTNQQQQQQRRNQPQSSVPSSKSKMFTCKYCDKIYMSLGALKMHIRTHTLPCKCTICGKSFSRPWLLQGHIRTHTGEKPYRCDLCQRAFADRSNLRAHLQTHSEVKRYNCQRCMKTFSRMSLLAKHEESGCNAIDSIDKSKVR